MNRQLGLRLCTAAICIALLCLGLGVQAAGNREVFNGVDFNYDVRGALTIVAGDDSQATMIQQFQQLYPNIKVNMVKWGGNWGERWAKYVITMKAGGQTAPDLIAIESQSVPKHSSYLEDLQKPPYRAGRLRHLYNPWVWRAVRSGKGAIALLQGDICTTCTWYRTDLLEQCGLPTDAAAVAASIKTPEALLQTAAKLKAKGYYILDDQIWTYQGALGLRMATTDWKPVWTDPKYNKKFAAYLDLYRTMKLRGLLGPSQWDYNNIKQVKYAMLPGCTWSWFWPIKDAGGEAEHSKWRVTDPILNSYGTWGGSGWAVSRTCKDKAAAWEYVKYATCHPKVWTNDPWLSIPALKGLWKEPIFEKNLPEFANAGQSIWKELFRITAVYHDGPANSTPVDSAINGDWYAMLQDYLEHGGDVQAVMAKWAQKAAADIEAFRKKEGVENAIEWEEK